MKRRGGLVKPLRKKRVNKGLVAGEGKSFNSRVEVLLLINAEPWFRALDYIGGMCLLLSYKYILLNSCSGIDTFYFFFKKLFCIMLFGGTHVVLRKSYNWKLRQQNSCLRIRIRVCFLPPPKRFGGASHDCSLFNREVPQSPKSARINIHARPTMGILMNETTETSRNG